MCYIRRLLSEGEGLLQTDSLIKVDKTRDLPLWQPHEVSSGPTLLDVELGGSGVADQSLELSQVIEGQQVLLDNIILLCGV